MLGRPRSKRLRVAVLAATIASLLPLERAPGGATIIEHEVARAHRAGAVLSRPTGRAPRAVLYRTGFPGAEPTLGAADDGTIFTVSWEPSTQVDVLRSADNGRTWEPVSPRLPGGENRHRLSFDPYLHLDESGERLFTVDLLVACSYLSFSDDLGETWTTNPLACGQPFNDHQSVFTGPPVTSTPIGYPNIVYYCFADYLDTGSFCSKSVDGGLSFLPAGEKAYPANKGDRYCGGKHGHGVTDLHGTVYLPADHCGQPTLAISRDEGATWARVRVSRLGHQRGPDPAVAVDPDGNLYYVWIARDRLPYLTTSRDGGRSWSGPVMIAAPGVREAAHVTLAAGDPAKIAVAYMGSDDSHFVRCAGEAGCRPSYADVTWDGYMGLTLDALSADPVFWSASVNGEDSLVEGKCGPRRCDWLLDFMDIIIGADGTPWASFVDSVDNEPNFHEGVVGRLVGGRALK